MTRHRRCLSLAFAAAAVLAAPTLLAAQPAAAAPQMFVVHVENVMPSKIAEYEASSKEFTAVVHANHQLMPLLSFTALQGEDLSYAYVAPIRDLADVDAINASFEAMGKAVGEARWSELMRRNGRTISGIDENVFVEVPAASYWPAGAAVTPRKAGYYQLDFYRVMPGMEDAAAEVAMAWKGLFESRKVPYGYSVFRLALGSDGPLWVVSTPASDPANLAMIQDASVKAIGVEAWQSQMDKTLAITRAFDSKRFRARPDLSLPPPAAAGR